MEWHMILTSTICPSHTNPKVLQVVFRVSASPTGWVPFVTAKLLAYHILHFLSRFSEEAVQPGLCECVLGGGRTCSSIHWQQGYTGSGHIPGSRPSADHKGPQALPSPQPFIGPRLLLRALETPVDTGSMRQAEPSSLQ